MFTYFVERFERYVVVKGLTDLKLYFPAFRPHVLNECNQLCRGH